MSSLGCYSPQAQIVQTTDAATATGDPQPVSYEVSKICMIDDDGNGVLTPFVEASLVTVLDDGSVQVTPMGDYTNSLLTTPYTPTGTVTAPSDTGAEPVLNQYRTLVTNVNWSPTALTTSYTIRNVTGNTSTYTDSAGNTTTIQPDEVITFSHDGTNILDIKPVVSASANDVLIVTYMELGV